MKKAIIIGATGFGGLGLIEILLRHPSIEITQLVARKDAGVPIDRVFPHLRGLIDLKVDSPDDIRYEDIDIAFFSTPDRAGMTLINNFYSRNIRVIDFSGDFRFTGTDEYSIYASNKGMDTVHHSPELLAHTVYGLPEINRTAIRSSRIVGNPGCFAVSMLLGLLPAVEKKCLNNPVIICDGKTGVSGAGKNPGESNFYPQRYENVNTYREGRHQHIVEVENILNSRSASPVKILFIPQIVPLNRGILTTIYADPVQGMNSEKLASLYEDYYRDSSFVIITDQSPNTTDVRGTNRCVIRPTIDERTGKMFITSVIDNLVKGQSGNAVQNANIMLDLEETAGLNSIAFYP